MRGSTDARSSRVHHQALMEANWVQPRAIRRFDQRSIGLLQSRQIERYLLLLHQYDLHQEHMLETDTQEFDDAALARSRLRAHRHRPDVTPIK
jgi:hypothetical protein